MKTNLRAISLIATVLLAVSCTTIKPNRSEIRHFDPLPATEVAVEDLEPVSPESVNKLLGDAEKAFREANAAQERGDHEGALKQYTAMLELLIEADLDPKVFYQLRTEFERILDTSFQEARLFNPAQTRTYRLADLPEFSSDIEIPDPLPAPVIDEIQLIQTGYPERFQAALDRSSKYIPYIRDELARAGLPQDLCWLAMVESQFTPKINSPAGAGGMWQFMRTTGKRYNLRIDGHVDERYDWQKSTYAAIGYLRDLYIFFDGDWALAVTAYNMGEGGLSRAMNAAAGERDIWTLISEGPSASIIRTETKKYYPRFLASIIVAKNPERYGFSRNPLAPDNFIRVPVDGSYSIAALEKSAGIDKGILAALNPELIRGITPPNGTHHVAVPSSSGQQVQLALQSAPKVKAETPRVHVVRRGETLAEIARKYRVSTRDLAKINKLRSANHLAVGQKLLLSPNAADIDPVPAEEPKSNIVVAKNTSPPTAAPAHEAEKKIYKVRRGDTLFDIALANHVSVSDLQAWNNMNRSSRIKIGDTLVISMPGVEAVKAPQEIVASGEAEDAPMVASLAKSDESTPDIAPRYHTVQRGEYPAKIAKLYGVGVNDFLKWNKLTPSSSIQIGDKLVVFAAASPLVGTTSDLLRGSMDTDTSKAAPAPEVTKHKVASGETASTIAGKYHVKTSDLLKWNKLTSKSILHIGDTLVINSDGGDPPQASQPNQGERIEHVVASGHNPTTIARRYGVSVTDLFAWNGWAKNPTLHPGDKVVVFKK